jgi:hypothetical protein
MKLPFADWSRPPRVRSPRQRSRCESSESGPYHTRRGLLLTALLPAFLLSACASTPLYEPTVFERQDQAGSAHVAVLSVAPWAKYREAVQPTFRIDEKQALDEVIPTTTRMEERFIDALKAALKLAPPRTSISEVTTTETATGKAPTTSSTSTEKRESGDVSSVELGAAPGGSVKDLAVDKSAREGALDVDPMLKYWAATALYEEVQLINRYLEDAAVDRGYEPYVVRLQVTLQPRARSTPYDAYANVSFFDGGSEDGDTTPPATPIKRLDGQSLIQGLASGAPAFRTCTKPKESESTVSPYDVPKVIPLLVTDNLEAAIHARTAERIRQYALAISVLSQGAAAGGEFQRLSDKLQSVLGQDLNSLLTVARVSENTLRVRLGAQRQSASGYAMLPRTHNISLLLLVPTGTTSAKLVARTEFVDARTGKTLAPRDPATSKSLMEDLAKRRMPGASQENVRNLLSDAQVNDYATFAKDFKCYEGASKGWASPSVAWVDLVSLMVGSRYSSAAFDLPMTAKPQMPPDQTVIVTDDGKSTGVAIRGAVGLEAGELGAILHAGELRLEPVSLTVGDKGRAVQMAFPSLKVLGHDAAKLAKSGKLALILADPAQACSYSQVAVVSPRPAAKPKKALSLAVPAAAVIANKNGKGTLRLVAELDAAHSPVKVSSREIWLTIRNADVTKVDPSGALTRSGARWKLAKAGAFTLDLANLDREAGVVIEATEKAVYEADGGKKTEILNHDPIVRRVTDGK